MYRIKKPIDKKIYNKGKS